MRPSLRNALTGSPLRPALASGSSLPWDEATSGVVQGVLYLDGSSSIEVADAASQTPGTNKFTICGWLYTLDAADQADCVVGKSDYSTQSAYYLQRGGGNASTTDVYQAWVADAVNDTQTVYLQTSGGAHVSLQWQFVALTFDGSQGTNATKLKLWIDANPLTVNFVGGGTVSTVIPDANTPLCIGCRRSGGNRVAPFKGYLRGVALYDRVLSEAEQWLCMQGSYPADAVSRWPLTINYQDAVGVNAMAAGAGSPAIVRGVAPAITVSSRLLLWTLGDSITVGFDDLDGYRGGYRRPLANSFWARGIVVRGVGSQNTVGGWSGDHDGVNGEKAAQIDARVAAGPYAADACVVMAGVNDDGVTALAQFKTDYAQLVADVCTEMGAGKRIVGVAHTDLAAGPGATSLEMRQFEIATWLAQAGTYDVTVARADLALTQPGDFAGGVHPNNSSGYPKLATEILAAYDRAQKSPAGPAVEIVCSSIGAGAVTSLAETSGQQRTLTNVGTVTADGSSKLSFSSSALICTDQPSFGAWTIGIVWQLGTPPAAADFCSLLSMRVGTSAMAEIALMRAMAGYTGISFVGAVTSGGGAAAGCGYDLQPDLLKHRAIITYDGGTVTSASSYTLLLDGVAQTVATSSTFARNADKTAIGARVSSLDVASKGIEGDVFRVDIFPRVLSGASLTALDAKLAAA